MILLSDRRYKELMYTETSTSEKCAVIGCDRKDLHAVFVKYAEMHGGQIKISLCAQHTAIA